MSTIHVASGVGVAPTEMAAYDAALADANLHEYNLVTVSSVVPAEADVERVGTAPDLGPAGNRLTVVEARGTLAPSDGVDEVAAGLGWATGPGPGLFYEAAGGDRASVREAISDGLDAGAELRDRTLPDRELCVESTSGVADAYACVVVVAAYGESEPIL